MYKLVLTFSFFSLFACSAPQMGMKNMNESPRGISILNIKSTKEERVKAYRAAEKHCAKYYKVPRILNSIKQEQDEEFQTPMHTSNFECLKPSN